MLLLQRVRRRWQQCLQLWHQKPIDGMYRRAGVGLVLGHRRGVVDASFAGGVLGGWTR